MKIQLDGFTAEIDKIYAYKTYAGLLAGVIDTRRNDYEESQAQDELKKFSMNGENHLYIYPRRKKRELSSFSKNMEQVIKEDFRDGFYSDENFPEKKLEAFWVYVELVSYDAVKDEDCFMSALNIACNVKDFEMTTIESYLLEHLTLEIWETNAIDATP